MKAHVTRSRHVFHAGAYQADYIAFKIRETTFEVLLYKKWLHKV
jgi:hypothetical protein